MVKKLQFSTSKKQDSEGHNYLRFGQDNSTRKPTPFLLPELGLSSPNETPDKVMLDHLKILKKKAGDHGGPGNKTTIKKINANYLSSPIVENESSFDENDIEMLEKILDRKSKNTS